MSLPLPTVSSNDATQSSSITVANVNESNDRRNRFNRRAWSSSSHLWTQRFEGKCEELKGHIFDSADARQADQYTKTIKENVEYVGRTYKYGTDCRLSIKNMKMITIDQPEDPPQNATRTEIRIWEKKVDNHVTRETILKEKMKSSYSLIWGQCSEIMQQKVEGSPKFVYLSQNGDAIELLRIIKDIAYKYQIQKHVPHALHEAKKRFYNCHQPCYQSTQA
jgi:plasmid stabilization system protein ParE